MQVEKERKVFAKLATKNRFILITSCRTENGQRKAVGGVARAAEGLPGNVAGHV